MLKSTYEIPEITENFCFRQRDIKYYLTDFFYPIDNNLYCFRQEMQRIIEKFLLAHKKALASLDEAKVVFIKSFGRFFQEVEKDKYHFDAEQLNRIYANLHDTIIILHWGQLPILNKWLMINSGQIPEENIVDFYDHYHMLSAIMRDIQGDSEKMTRQGDKTLNQELTFSIFNLFIFVLLLIRLPDIQYVFPAHKDGGKR